MIEDIEDDRVRAVFAGYNSKERQGTLELRQLIFEMAAELPGVGPLEEALRWGQPAYLTSKTKSGSTLRLGCPKTGGFALYAHCRTSIISSFRDLFPAEFTYEGNRAIHFQDAEEIQPHKLRLLIRHALTYHL